MCVRVRGKPRARACVSINVCVGRLESKRMNQSTHYFIYSVRVLLLCDEVGVVVCDEPPHV